jgi:hypothetical protein
VNFKNEEEEVDMLLKKYVEEGFTPERRKI